MASGEQNITALPVKTNTGVANSDYFMGIDSAEGYQILIRDLAKYIMENYNGSTLAGSAQTPKAAIDALNSKTDISVTQNSEQDKFRITTKYCKKIGNLLCINIEVVTTNTIRASDGFVSIATFGISTIPDTRFTVIEHWGHNVQCTVMLYQSSLKVYCPKETAANEYFLVFATIPL